MEGLEVWIDRQFVAVIIRPQVLTELQCLDYFYKVWNHISMLGRIKKVGN